MTRLFSHCVWRWHSPNRCLGPQRLTAPLPERADCPCPFVCTRLRSKSWHFGFETLPVLLECSFTSKNTNKILWRVWRLLFDAAFYLQKQFVSSEDIEAALQKQIDLHGREPVFSELCRSKVLTNPWNSGAKSACPAVPSCGAKRQISHRSENSWGWGSALAVHDLIHVGGRCGSGSILNHSFKDIKSSVIFGGLRFDCLFLRFWGFTVWLVFVPYHESSIVWVPGPPFHEQRSREGDFKISYAVVSTNAFLLFCFLPKDVPLWIMLLLIFLVCRTQFIFSFFLSIHIPSSFRCCAWTSILLVPNQPPIFLEKLWLYALRSDFVWNNMSIMSVLFEFISYRFNCPTPRRFCFSFLWTSQCE